MKRQTILVLGMHRSGTSLVTRLLNLLGAELPKTLLGQNEGNERGHWESRLIIDHHDSILSEMESNWKDYRPLPIHGLPTKKRNEFITDIRHLFESEFEDQKLSVVKEPRMCRFVPLYLNALEQANAQAHCVLVNRHPLEVAKSLSKRDGIAMQHGLLLWLSHMLIAERETRSTSRVFINHKTILKSPIEAMQSIVKFFNTPFPHTAEDIREEVLAFVTPSLKRNHAETEALDLNPLTQGWISKTYQALSVLTQNPNSESAISTLESVWSEFKHAAPLLYASQLDFQKALALRDTIIASRDQDIQKQQRDHQSSWVEAEVNTQAKLAQLKTEQEGAWKEAEVEAQKAVSALTKERDDAIKAHEEAVKSLENHHKTAWKEAEVETRKVVSALTKERDDAIKAREEAVKSLEDHHKTAWKEAEVETQKAVSTLTKERDDAIRAYEDKIQLLERKHNAAWEQAKITTDLNVKALQDEHAKGVSNMENTLERLKTEIGDLKTSLSASIEEAQQIKSAFENKERQLNMILMERDFMQNEFEQLYSLTEDALARSDTEKNQQQQAYEEELNVRLKAILALKDEVHALKTSRIWRMTSKLRSVANLIKGQKHTNPANKLVSEEKKLRLTHDKNPLDN